MFKEYFFPMMKEVIAAAKCVNPDVLVFYHSCGNIEPLVDLFIEAGVDILDPIQPETMDIYELKRRYGRALCFHGGIGIQSTLLYGTPREVRDTVRKTIDAMAEGGGYICVLRIHSNTTFPGQTLSRLSRPRKAKPLNRPDDRGVAPVVEEGFHREDAAAEAALADAGIGNALGEDVVAVDPVRAGHHRLGHAVCPGQIGGPDTIGQAVAGVVGQPDRLGFIGKRGQEGHRAENLLAGGDVVQRAGQSAGLT